MLSFSSVARALPVLALTLGLAALTGCGGGHHNPAGGTPRGLSTLTVTGTSGKLTASATVSLTVN